MLGNHLLGIYEKAFDSKQSLPEILYKAKSLGFDYVEISIDETDERLSRLDWTKAQIEELRRSCYEAGIGFQSMCLSGHRRFPFGSADPKVRARAYDIMGKAIDFAWQMGIRVIQLAGYDVYYEESTPQSRRRFQEGMRWAAKEAARKQIMLATEIMDTPFINSISKNQMYEAMLGSPWFHSYPDLGNLSAWPENDVMYELTNGIRSIVAVHLKDTIAVTEQSEGIFKKVPFGAGCVDFPACFKRLEELGYAGPYMIEMWNEEGIPDSETIMKAVKWLSEKFEEGCARS